MNILFLTPSYPPMIGGGERYAAALAEELCTSHHHVTIVTSDARRQEDFWHGTTTKSAAPLAPSETRPGTCRILRCPVRPVPLARNGLHLWRKLMVMLSALPGDHRHALTLMAARVPGIAFGDTFDALAPFDLIHAFNISWEHPMVRAAQLAQERGIPLVVTPFAHLGSGPRDRVALNNTMQHQMTILRQADAVLTLTSIERDGLVARGVDAQRIQVLPGGLDVADTTEETPRAALDLPSPYVCFVGRNSRDKGALQTLQAVNHLLQSGTHVDLVMVGAQDRAFAKHLNGLTSERRAHIHVLGLVDEATKQQIIAGSTMLVLPSHVDSFGIVFLEAWRHGKPVIGAHAGGIPGLIREGIDGLLVEHGDARELAQAMERLLSDPETAARLGAAGNARLGDEFEWHHLGQRLMNLYAVLIGRDEPSEAGA